MSVSAAEVHAACPGFALFREWKWFSARGPAGEATSPGGGAGGGAAPHGLNWAPFPGAAILLFSMAPVWAAGSGANPAPRA